MKRGWGKATTAHPRPGDFAKAGASRLVRPKHADHEEPQQHIPPPVSGEDKLSFTSHQKNVRDCSIHHCLFLPLPPRLGSVPDKKLLGAAPGGLLHAANLPLPPRLGSWLLPRPPSPHGPSTHSHQRCSARRGARLSAVRRPPGCPQSAGVPTTPQCTACYRCSHVKPCVPSCMFPLWVPDVRTCDGSPPRHRACGTLARQCFCVFS
jgi:hypothetical protein